MARPPSRIYQFRKLVRRNKLVFTSMFAVTLSLVAGLAVSSRLLIKERAARRRAVLAEQMAIAAQETAMEAERQQMLLRRRAEDRERITMAAYLIGQGRIEEAHAEVDQITTELTPSLETGSVLRTLAEWIALRGDWDVAVKYFKMLLDVDIRDSSFALTADLLMAGPILVEHEGPSNYEMFRQKTIALCQGLEDLAAERVLKISLLLPADEETMRSIEPFAQVTAEVIEESRQSGDAAAWSSISMALWSYRSGDFSLAMEWSAKGMTLGRYNEARNATAHIIRAMACFQMNQHEQARTELWQGGRIIEARLRTGPSTRE